MARIFVSYKRDDLKKVKPLIDEIERRTGEKCWYDLDGIETSVQFASVICSAIDSADIVLFLHSRNHLGIDFQNDWTVRELTYAHESKKRVVLIKLDNTPLRNIFQMFYGGTNNVKINDSIQKEKLFRDLNSWLKKKEEKLEPVQPQLPFHRRKWFWPAISGVFATFVIIAGVLLGGGSKTTEPKPENPNGAKLSTPTTPTTPVEPEKPLEAEISITTIPAVPVEPEKPAVIEVQSLSLNKTTLTLTEGETETLTVTVKPTNATDKKVTWKSTNPKVATVSSSGKITAKTPGNTSIIAQCGGKEVSCDIVVKEKPAPEPTTVAVQSISLSNESLTLTVGDTKTLNVTFTPSNATDKGVEWQSTNSGVASVNNNGLVTAKAAGSTTIIASAGGKVKYCNVTVKEKAVPVTNGANGVYTVNGVQFKMIRVSGGTFNMGATKDIDPDAIDLEAPIHSVTLRDYWIGETEVTQELWTAVMGNNPSRFKGNNQLPVECVSYEDCKTFISKLNSLTGKSFRLPTEAEWEFAARGGNNSRGYKYSGSNNIEDVARFNLNSSYTYPYSGVSRKTTSPVKTRRANELGVYDMSGNVYEWCSDWYGSYSSDSAANPKGPNSASSRVVRGGSWGSPAGDCRITDRGRVFPGYLGSDLGLRLAL